MADILFQGPAALTLDQKGRIAFPARHREKLAAMGEQQLTITQNPEGSLMIFPRSTWLAFQESLMKLPYSAAAWRRIFMGNAMDVDIDASSRVLISPELRNLAGLERDVLMLGVGRHLELWNPQRHAAHTETVLASEMPDAVKNFCF